MEPTLLEYAMKLIKTHEGYKDTVYVDSEDYPTVGYGHKILPQDNLNVGDVIDSTRANNFFVNDFNGFIPYAQKVKGFSKFSVPLQASLIDMTYNMGPSWIGKFPKFIEALNDTIPNNAPPELTESKWATQVPNRAKNIIDIVKATGR